MIVRPATLDDLPDLLEIARQFIQEAPNYSSRELDEQALTENLSQVIQGAGTVFVAVQDHEIAGGIVCLTTKDWFNNQVIAFEQVFYVKPAYRSTRAALYLIDTFITWAKHMNAGRIQCGTTTGINTQGCIRLYNHFGLKEHGTLLDMEL